VYALQTALRRTNWAEKIRQIAESAVWLRGRLRELGFEVLADQAFASPAVFTIILPPGVTSKTIGAQLKNEGYLLSHQSGYLLKRNWIQICLMGEWEDSALKALPDLLAGLCAGRDQPAAECRLQAVSS
jgi:aspartate aminotransferase-like enzyme